MAKKKTARKPNLSQEALERAKRELAESGFVVTETTANEAVAPSPKPRLQTQAQVVRSKKTMMTKEELATEYGYVLTDLRNMGALAGVLFVAMVVVSLLINQLV